MFGGSGKSIMDEELGSRSGFFFFGVVEVQIHGVCE